MFAIFGVSRLFDAGEGSGIGEAVGRCLGDGYAGEVGSDFVRLGEGSLGEMKDEGMVGI